MQDQDLKLPYAMIGALRCPGRPDLPVRRDGNRLVAGSGESMVAFPIVNGTPILINEENSVFRIADFENGGVTTMDLRPEAERLDTPVKRVKTWLNALIPVRSRSINDFPAHAALAAILAERPDAAVLVVGAGDARFTADCSAIVYTDVALGPDTHLIADAHDIPFADGSFDAVFAIAVMEHVADPYRCVSEIRRVLKPRGFVYAATPFMQQVHMGRYDFTRFTALGHRRLFRWFDELRAGIANGPGMAVSWSLEYLFASFSERKLARSLLRTAARFAAWPFLLLDGWIARKAGAYDCASAFYFFGRLRDSPVPDRQVITEYKGLN